MRNVREVREVVRALNVSYDHVRYHASGGFDLSGRLDYITTVGVLDVGEASPMARLRYVLRRGITSADAMREFAKKLGAEGPRGESAVELARRAIGQPTEKEAEEMCRILQRVLYDVDSVCSH